MNESNRRAIVWREIERLAFRPRKPQTWLGVYGRSFQSVWEEPPIVRFDANREFDIPFFKLICSYSIENADKYSVTFKDSSTDIGVWQIHVDPNYHSNSSLLAGLGKYPTQHRSDLIHDIEKVLESMLFHPRCHSHLEDAGVTHVQLSQNGGGLSSHEVRLGGGIENPYVFLFHIRYQFCLVSSEVRDQEKDRLISLFEANIRSKSSVNACELFKFK